MTNPTRDVFQLELEKRNVVQAEIDPLTGRIKTSAGSIGLMTVSNANTAIGIGDSIMRAQGTVSNTASFLEYAAIASKGAIKLMDNKGVNGNKTADILARITDVTASPARFVFVMEAANDAMNGVSVSTHRTNMTAIVQAILNAGQVPIIVGAPPCNGYDVWKYNAADQSVAALFGVPYVNPWMACTANGQWIDTTWAIDGVHPTPKASRTAGVSLWSQVSSLFVGSPDLTWTNDDPSGILTNGCFLTNSSGVPTGWTGAGNVTHSIVAGTGDVVGNWWRQTASGITGWAVNTRTGIALPSNWQAGDRVRLSCRIKTSGYEANGSAGNNSYPMQGKIGTYLSFNWGGVSEKLILREVDGDTDGVYSIDGVIPATSGTSSIQFVTMQTASASGVIDIAQLQMHNLSLLARQ